MGGQILEDDFGITENNALRKAVPSLFHNVCPTFSTLSTWGLRSCRNGDFRWNIVKRIAYDQASNLNKQ